MLYKHEESDNIALLAIIILSISNVIIGGMMWRTLQYKSFFICQLVSFIGNGALISLEVVSLLFLNSMEIFWIGSLLFAFRFLNPKA
jgi:hypothetical protein